MTNSTVELESKPCPLGCSPADEKVLTGYDRINDLPGEFDVVRCGNCGLLRTNPRPTPASIGFYYPDDYSPYLDTRVMSGSGSGGLKHWIKSLLDTKAQLIPKLQPGEMLEVGCASGNYLHKMASQGWQVKGIEFSPQAAASAREAGYQVYTGSLESIDLESSELDLITGWMVLEHLHDPLKGVKKLHDWAKPGAYLVLSVPNAGSIEFKLFLSRWYALHLPNHLYHFTPKTMTKLLQQAGWQVESIHHQRVLSSFFSSLGYLLQDRGWPRLARWVVGRPSDKVRLYQLLYPFAWLAAIFGQTGRMTVWAKKPD
ncbi:MAG: class I SAM-dependent methyltransferase [Candidatus Thiodiazotropha taylori]|nr:class I SAM-dependent methyltransferase [Candidatus Thiodiazotropha taylori]RLW64219.1 MAG: methyltransferase type 12 [gamma proteobacterium symbiont of Stewartia floridana]